MAGNFVDIETGDEYWISGIKKDGNDRHWSGSGVIKIDRNVVDLYLRSVGEDKLNSKRFEITDILPTDKQRFKDLENQKMN